MVIDSGNNAYTEAQARVFLRAMQLMRYDAAGVGPAEKRISSSYCELARDLGVPVVKAADVQGALYVIKRVNGIRIGITAFDTPSAEQATLQHARLELTSYAEARSKSDILIVMDQAGRIDKRWVDSIGKRLGEPDIVIGGPANSTLQSARRIGRVCIPRTSVKGASVGIVKVRFVPGEPAFYELSQAQLLVGMPDDPSVARLIENYIAGQRVAPSASPAGPASDKMSASPEGCKICHQLQYESWKRTKHARALTTLTSQGKNVPECLRCHSESYRRTGSYIDPKSEPSGVDCASCHDMPVPQSGSQGHSSAGTVNEAKCAPCHDKLNSPDYDVKAYWPKILHKR